MEVKGEMQQRVDNARKDGRAGKVQRGVIGAALRVWYKFARRVQRERKGGDHKSQHGSSSGFAVRGMARRGFRVVRSDKGSEQGSESRRRSAGSAAGQREGDARRKRRVGSVDSL